jgi:hypothetical protein
MICSLLIPNLNEDQLILKNFIFDEDANLEEDKTMSGSIFITTFLFPILTHPNDFTSWISSTDVRKVVCGGQFQRSGLMIKVHMM